MAGRPYTNHPRHESNFVPNRSNRNDTRRLRSKEEQKAFALKSATEIQTRLRDLLNDRNRSCDRIVCESYLEILDKLLTLLQTTSSERIYEKCASSLREINRRIPELEYASHGHQFASSPDSTEVFVDLTSENHAHSSNDRTSHDYNEISIPDSTVNEVTYSRLNGFKEPVNLNNIDNEVSSSQNAYKMRNSPHPAPEAAYPTLFSRRRGDNVRHMTENNASEMSNIDDPVQLIMHVAKTTANCITDKTDYSNGNEPRNTSSLPPDIDPMANERLLNQALIDLHKISDLNEIGDDVIETFSRNSQEQIEGYEDSVKSKFYDRDSETIEINDFPNSSADAAVAADEPSPFHSVSSILQKVMEDTSNRNADHPDGLSSRRSSSANSSNSVNEPAPFNLPNITNLNLSSNAGVSNVSKEKTEGHVSARKKLTQEIEVVHKVGEVGKINPSLKQLRSDIKKPSTSTTPSEVTVPRPGTPREKDDSIDRGSSMSISPEEPGTKTIIETCEVKKSSDYQGRGRSPARSGASRDRTPFRSSGKPSHSYKDSRKPTSRFDRNRRNEPRTRFPSPDNRSSLHSRDPMRPRSHSKEYSSDSSKSYHSPREDGSKYDKNRKFDDNRRRKSRSRSRSRYRGGYKSSNPYSIDRRSPSSKIRTSYEHSLTLENFVNNIGGGQTGGDESSKKDAIEKKSNEDKKDAENGDNRANVSGETSTTRTLPEKDTKPTIKAFKKSAFKFKLNTNCSKNILKNETDKKTPETVEPDDDRSDFPPPSPAPNDSPLLVSGNHTPDISAVETRPTVPFSEPPYRINNTANIVPNDPRRSIGNNFMKRGDNYGRISGADPRLKNCDRLPKNTDPRLMNGEKFGFPRNDPRIPVNVASGFENDVTRAPYIPNKSKPNEFIPHKPFNKFDSKENKSNKNTSSYCKDRPNNVAVVCDNSPPKPDKFKHRFQPSFEKKPAKAPNKPMNTEALKETVKNQTSFYSPLADVQPELERAKTGRGYGVQKPKTFNKNFRIPKVKKPVASAPAEDGNENWDTTTNEDCSTFNTSARRSSFHDGGLFGERRSSQDFSSRRPSSTEEYESLAQDSSISNQENEDRAGALADINTSPSGVNYNTTKTTNERSSGNFEETKAPAKQPEPVQSDVSANVLDDEEECWDPIDSPDCVINDEPPIDDDDDEPVIISETSNVHPEVIDISECNYENPNSAERVENQEDERPDDRATRADSLDKNSDIIEIHDSDEIGRAVTPPRPKSPNMKIQKVYTLEEERTTPPKDISPPTETQSAVIEQNSAPSEQEDPEPGDKLKQLIIDYLKSQTNFKGKIDQYEKLTAAEFFYKVILLPELTQEMFMHIKKLNADYNSNSNSNSNTDETASNVDPVDEVACEKAEETGQTALPEPSTSHPVKRKMGKKANRKRKNACVEKPMPTKKPEPSQDTAAPVKKRCRELDGLHADLEQLRHTKNNIFTIGEKRSCRLQNTNYTDGSTSRSRLGSTQNKSNKAHGSDTEDDDIVRASGYRNRNQSALDSDSESTMSVGSRKPSRIRSKAFISDDSDTSDMSVVTTKKAFAKSPDFGRNEILKSKPCPRRVKVQRFGSSYEKFEKSEAQKYSYLSKPPFVILPMGACEELSTCVCKTRTEYSIDKKTVEARPSVSNYKGKTGQKRNHAESEDDTIVQRKVSPLKIKRVRKTVLKKTGKVGVVSEMKKKMSRVIGTPTSWSQDKKPKISPKKAATAKEKVDEIQERDIPNVKATTLQYPMTEAIPPLDEKPIISEDDANEDLEGYPCYNAFKDSNVKEIKIATISVKAFEPGLVYTCSTPRCDNYETRDCKMMSLHLNFLHRQVKCNDTCPLCGDDKKFASLKAALMHFLLEHLTVTADQQEQMVFQNVRVKEEPIDVDQMDCDDQRAHEIICEPPISSAPQSVPTGFPAVNIQPPVKVTTPLPQEARETPSPNVTSSEKPKLRVRRLSGDKLSGFAEPSKNVEAPGAVAQTQDQTEAISSTATPNTRNSAINSHVENVVSGNEDFGAVIDDLNSPEVYRIRLYHCSGAKCDFTSNHEKEFVAHLHSVHRAVLNKFSSKRSKKVDQSCLVCVYCKEKFETPEMLVNHMDRYKDCKFQCAYCAYRASRPVFLVWHQKTAHPVEPARILVPDYEDNKLNILESSVNKEKDLKEVVLPFSCTHCNNFDTISLQEYKDHWKKNHSQTNIWTCQECNIQSFSSEMHFKHLMLHGLGEYQCVYCLSSSRTEEAMKMHLTNYHYTLYPKAVNRVTPTDGRRADTLDHSVKEFDWDECVESFKTRLQAVNQTKLSVVTLYKDTDENDPSGGVAVTGIYKINGNMEYVLDMAETKKHRELRKSSNADGRANTDETPNAEMTDGLPISIDSSDDDANDRLVICEETAPVEVPVPKSTQSKSTFVTNLSGVELYKCGFSGCAAAFQDYHSFKEHLSTCDNARSRTSPRCPHCNRNFQQNAKFLGHIAVHSVPRFLCSLCTAKFTSEKKAEDHFKHTHKVAHCKVTAANAVKQNIHEDIFIAVPNPDKSVKGATKQYKKPFDAKTNASNATNVKYKEAYNTAKRITKVYSCEEVEKNLPMQLFSEPVTCGICSTYNSKVRTNIINHLKCHSTGLVPQKDITNPVPCMDKSELMFNKMTNHAAFSATKTDDKKIKCLIEHIRSFKKKAEPYSGKKNEIIPGFVPRTLRFSCNAPDCRYISTDANGLKSHWETLHSDLNFGQALERHQLESHPNSSSSIQVIRDLSAEEVEELSRDARLNYDKPHDRGVGKFVKANQWKCNLCKFSVVGHEDTIKSHCFASHRVTKKYKCSLCMTGDDNRDEVVSHMKQNHESISQIVVAIYSELNDGEESGQSSSESGSPSKPKEPPRSPPSTAARDTRSRSTPNPPQNDVGRGVARDKQQHSGGREETLQNGDINHLFILPAPNNRYKCPYCEVYTSESREIITDHLYQEKNYMKYVCTTCGATGATEHEIFKHMKAAEHSTENIAKLTEDEVLENQVEQILNYQRSKFDQVNHVVLNSDSIVVDDSEDEISESQLARIIDNCLSTPKPNPTDFKCPHCPKKCSSSSGLKNHMTVKHKSKIIPSSSKPMVPMVKMDSANYPCPLCEEEFPASDVLKHLCRCPKYQSSGVTSPIKRHDQLVSANTEQPVICPQCDKKLAPSVASEHIANCQPRSSTHSKAKKICVLCTFEGDDVSMAKHTKAEHEPMECLNCNKVLIGTKELEHHVRLSVININGSDEDCAAQEKEVVFMCPYCPIGLRGQTYDKYMYVSNHMETKHSPKSKPQPMMVKINNSKRELLEIEIANMQNKFNNEQNQSVGAAKKRRNVAVKSTSRSVASNIAHDSRTASVARIQRVGNDFEPLSEYVRIVPHGRKTDYHPRRA